MIIYQCICITYSVHHMYHCIIYVVHIQCSIRMICISSGYVPVEHLQLIQFGGQTVRLRQALQQIQNLAAHREKCNRRVEKCERQNSFVTPL